MLSKIITGTKTKKYIREGGREFVRNLVEEMSEFSKKMFVRKFCRIRYFVDAV